MRKINAVTNRPYKILLHQNFDLLEDEIKAVCKPSQICIITDTNLEALYLKEVENICSKITNTFVYVYEAGEASKNLTTITQIYDTLVAHNMDRSGLIVALGGGVVGDMAGFAASSYMRGIKFIQVPTTTVAQNDSSMGGKTGVDYLAHKNMVGAFYNPLLVYSNLATLKSLPEREFTGGLAEVIKHGLIRDVQLFNMLEANVDKILNYDDEAIEEMTYASCLVKCSVIEEDLKELGLRKILNFGHTIGHSIETLSNFTLSHGQCVAYGSCMAAYISARRGYIDEKTVERIVNVFRSYKLLSPIAHFDKDAVWEQMSYDKKMAYGKISFILLNAIGEATIVTDVTKEEIINAILFIEKTCL